MGKTLEEYLQLHGYCFGSKPGRVPWQSTAARPAASEPVSSVHSEYEPDSPPNQGDASPLAHANSITAEGCSRPTKRRCTRLTRQIAGAVSMPSLSRAAVQAQDDTSSVRGTSESQIGDAKAAPDMEKVRYVWRWSLNMQTHCQHQCMLEVSQGLAADYRHPYSTCCLCPHFEFCSPRDNWCS